MAKVLKGFNDLQDNKKYYKKGSDYSGPRLDELIEKGYVEAEKAKKKTKKKE